MLVFFSGAGVLVQKGRSYDLYMSVIDTFELKQKKKNQFLCKMQISSCSGYGNRIKLKNNASLDFNGAHLCFFCRSNFWLSSAHSVWTWKFHSSAVRKPMHWSCRKKRWVTEYAAISPYYCTLYTTNAEVNSATPFVWEAMQLKFDFC